MFNARDKALAVLLETIDVQLYPARYLPLRVLAIKIHMLEPKGIESAM